ncbi:MAG TPA: DUF2232 domain-containing protein [Peptococcaceae bacterium]|nr:DUF2232 domain-containing protein [Peptococcaceae bacterium]
MAKFFETPALKDGFFTLLFVVLLGLVGLFIPSFMMLIQLFWAVPLIVLLVRHGFAFGLYTFVFIFAILLVLAGPVQALILLLPLGGVSWAYGLAFRKDYRPRTALLLGVGVTMAAFLGLILFLVLQRGITLDYISQQLQANVEPMIEKYRSEGLFNKNYPGFTEETFRQQLQIAVQTIIRLFPALSLIWGTIVAAANYFFARSALQSLEMQVPVVSPLSQWQLPWWVIWGFIFGYAAYLWGDYYEVAWALVVGQNIMLLYALVFFVLGCAVASFFLKKYISSSNMRWVVVLLCLLFTGILLVVLLVLLGLLDLLFNYRKLARA